MAMTLADDQAMAVLKLHGRSFHFASHLLGRVYRARAARLYAFCRYVDDLVDEASDPLQATQDLEQLEKSLQTGESKEPCVASMIALMRELSIPMAPVQALIEGVRSDLSARHIKDESELLCYSYQVAGTVGLIMCVLLDVSHENASPFAVDLGIAMQLTNIARDVGEDAIKGRVYLPADWLDDITATDIVSPSPTQAESLRLATKRLLNLAEHYYQSGLDGVVYLPSTARYGIVAAAMVYREIGHVIAQSNYCSWKQRAIVPQSRKWICAATGLASYARRPGSRLSNPTHNPKLHQHLQKYVGGRGTLDP
jgi:15-cis-phytoene synthase